MICFVSLSAKDKQMTLQKIEIRCCKRSDELIDKYFGNLEDVTYYKGLLKRYAEDLLTVLRCDFMEDVRKIELE